jgi:hypothetical protein
MIVLPRLITAPGAGGAAGALSRQRSAPTGDMGTDSRFPSTGLVVLTQIRQSGGEVGGRAQGVGVVVTQCGAAQIPGAFEQRPGGGGFPRLCRYNPARSSSQAMSCSTPVRVR